MSALTAFAPRPCAAARLHLLFHDNRCTRLLKPRSQPDSARPPPGSLKITQSDRLCQRTVPLVVMVKCPGGHSLRNVHVKSAKECDSCDGTVEVGSDVFRCGTCDYDLCKACFTAAQKSQAKAAKGKSLVKQGFLKTTTEVRPPKTSSSSASGSMSVDAKAVFSFSGFPMGSIPLEIFTLIREHVHDYLGDFSLTVIGTCVSDGAAHVGVEYNISEAEALGVKIFELRDHWAFEGQYLTTLMVEHPEVFVVPVPEPAHVPVPEAAHDVPSALPGSAPVHVPAPAPVQPKAPSAPASSPLFASPNRRLVERVFRTVTQDPPPGLQGLPQTPVLPGADPDAKLDKVLHSLDALTTFIKSEVVTRTHLDKYH